MSSFNKDLVVTERIKYGCFYWVTCNSGVIVKMRPGYHCEMPILLKEVK